MKNAENEDDILKKLDRNGTGTIPTFDKHFTDSYGWFQDGSGSRPTYNQTRAQNWLLTALGLRPPLRKHPC